MHMKVQWSAQNNWQNIREIKAGILEVDILVVVGLGMCLMWLKEFQLKL